MKYFPNKDTKFVGVRDLARNLSYYLDNADGEPFVIQKHGEIKAFLYGPFGAAKKPVTKTKQKLSDSPFFTQFSEAKSGKEKSSLEISQKLRDKAWNGS